MAATTKIEWATATWNPWIGCSKVSAACRHCYAEREQADRRGRVVWGPNGTRSRTTEQYWRQLDTWHRKAECLGTSDCANGDHADCCPQSPANRPRVFLGSLCDVFEAWEGPIFDHRGGRLWRRWEDGRLQSSETRPNPRWSAATMDDLRADLWRLVERCTNLDLLLLTKRPQNVPGMVPEHWLRSGGQWPENLWAGVTVENQAAADERIWPLLELPAPVRFLSMEPLLGPVNLGKWLPIGRARMQCQKCRAFLPSVGDCPHCGADCCYLSGSHAANVRDPNPRSITGWTSRQPLDWLITGGESGPESRPSCPTWFRDVRDVAVTAHVAFMHKQWGDWAPKSHGAECVAGREWGTITDAGDWFELTTPWNGNDDNGRGEAVMVRVGKVAAGNVLDGRQWLQVPRPVDRRVSV